MIANITKGKKAVGAILYDFGPGRRDEHVNPRFVEGNVPGLPLQVARMIDHTAKLRPEIANPIWRCSLSLPDEDGVRSDQEWGEIAAKFIGEMGFASAPWVAVRHGDDHIHLTVSRVDFNGKLLSDQYDYRRARAAADELEENHGLVRAADRFRPEGPQVRNKELEAANRRGAAPPEREELRRIIREVRDASAGLGRAAFESGLTDAGVGYRANIASTGRMNGYSFTLEGWVDGKEEQVWIPASKVAKDLRWAQLGKIVGDVPPKATVPGQATPDLSPALQKLRTEVATGQLTITQEQAQRLADTLQEGRIARGNGLPEDDPALSTDPAKRLLEQWKLKAAGEKPPAIPASPPGEPVAAWNDKRRRPFGRLSHAAIPKAITKAQKGIDAAAGELEKAKAEFERWDARVTGATTGLAVQDLLKRRARLEEAAPYVAEAEKQMSTATAASNAANAAREVWRDADRKKSLTRWERITQNVSKSAEVKRAATAASAISMYEDQAQRARHAASKADDTAREKAGTRDPGSELKAMPETWPTELAAAESKDQAYATQSREFARSAMNSASGKLGGHQKDLERLQEEKSLRSNMPDHQHTAEGKARKAAAREKAAALPPPRRGPRKLLPGEQPSHLRKPPAPGGRGPRR